MVNLDFTNCKSKEDVDKVFQKEGYALRNAKAMMDRVQHSENYCSVCGKKMGGNELERIYVWKKVY